MSNRFALLQGDSEERRHRKKKKCREDKKEQKKKDVAAKALPAPFELGAEVAAFEEEFANLRGSIQRLGRPAAVLAIDIDHFKRINDLHGHDAGDRVIREVARRLRAHTRSLDMACRYGGEEFVILMPETTLDTAEGVAERLRKLIEAEAFALPSQDEMLVTVSIGVAGFAGRDDNGEAMIKRADQALYEAKGAGRNKVARDRKASAPQPPATHAGSDRAALSG